MKGSKTFLVRMINLTKLKFLSHCSEEETEKSAVGLLAFAFDNLLKRKTVESKLRTV
jgi:hypothetical protein